MATNPKKGKGPKESDKKGSKKSEETTPVEEKISETPIDTDQEVIEPSETPVVEETPRDPTPEPVYEEPVLTQLIVTSFEGQKEKGLYEGDGAADFTLGHNYQGQFSEGLMHGKGSYRWGDGVVYEGELTRNNISGKGVYKWVDGSTYEGDVLNGLRHNFGTFNGGNNTKSYTGDWVSGKRNGKGRMNYDPDGMSFYEGDWIDNVRHGWGTRRYPSGNLYQGMWFNNLRHGEGTMRWLDKDQMYNGQWENGVQHGLGQHIWFLKRVGGSQYPLRNMYDGEFVKGVREGFGIFYYANGARYEGEWKNNMKHGKGKFIFKNGRVYEGVFEKDHIMEFPTFEMDGVTTPDMTKIRTRTPLPSEQMSVASNDSRNTYSPSFQLDVDHLLHDMPESDRDEEAAQVIYVIMRYITALRKVYNLYSGLGYEESLDNTFVMNRMQFWRFVKDCRLHHYGITLNEMDRVIAGGSKIPTESIHDPFARILFREFTNYLVTLAHHVFKEEYEETEQTRPLLAWCMQRLISDNILKFSCTIKGYIYYETRRASNAMVHMDQAYEVFKSFSKPRKLAPHEPALKMRQFLYMMKDLKLINSDLTPKDIIEILASDDPNVSDGEGSINLELEMTFLEFFEALVGCAQIFVTESVVKDPTTPRPSTTLTQEQSLLSMGSPSRAASQFPVRASADHVVFHNNDVFHSNENMYFIEEGQEDGTIGHTTPGVDASENGSPQPRSASQNTTKTVDGSVKQPDQQASNATGVSEAASHHHPGSARSKSEVTLDHKKMSSCISYQSGASEHGGPPTQLVQSVASLAHSEAPVEDEDGEEEEEIVEEELDEQTRQYNFWTHQLHIFFVRKFFPCATKFIILANVVKERHPEAPVTDRTTTTRVSSPQKEPEEPTTEVPPMASMSRQSSNVLEAAAS